MDFIYKYRYMKFSYNSYTSNDKVAKEATIKALTKRYNDIEVKENTDRYGIDLIIYQAGKVIGYAECERSSCWTNGAFPYKSVRLPSRKMHFLYGKDAGDKDLPNGILPIMFTMVSSDCKEVLMYSDEVARNCPSEEVPNYRTGSEIMVIIPKDKTIQVNI